MHTYDIMNLNTIEILNMTTSSRLTQKESKFVAAYLTDPSIKEAAISAGYLSNPSSQGCRVLNRPRVQNAIQTEQQGLQERHQIDRDNLVRKLLACYRSAHRRSDTLGMIRAVRELGLLCGLYGTTEPSKSDAGVDLMSMSDKELERIISSASKPTARGS